MALLRQRSGVRQSIALFLLSAVFVRALIPSGFMPVVGPDGDVRIAFCPGVHMPASQSETLDDPHRHHRHGATDRAAPASHSDHQAPGGAGDGHSICAFAAGAPGAPIPAAIVPVAMLPVGLSPMAPPEIVAGTVASILRSQFPRAPPAQV